MPVPESEKALRDGLVEKYQLEIANQMMMFYDVLRQLVGELPWTPRKLLSKSRVKAVIVDSDTSEDEVCLKDCLSLDYRPHDGVPGFDIETGNDSFWAPIAHRTRSATCGQLKSIVETSPNIRDYYGGGGAPWDSPPPLQF